jgi:hypothetical protein
MRCSPPTIFPTIFPTVFPIFDPEQLEQHGRDVLEDGRVERVDDLLPAPLRPHEVRGLEHVEVMRHRALREREGLRELPRRPRAPAQEREHLAAARIRQRLEDLVRSHDRYSLTDFKIRRRAVAVKRRPRAARARAEAGTRASS